MFLREAIGVFLVVTTIIVVAALAVGFLTLVSGIHLVRDLITLL